MTLAQAGPEIAPLLLPVLIGMAGVAMLIALAVVVRKKILKLGADSSTDPAAGFSMGSLRQLVREGKMTQEEFDAAKARIVAGAQRDTDKEIAKKSLSERPAKRGFDVAGDAPIVEHKPPTID
ncbi:MAG TPA: hypothetical protein VF624_06705 [Tepidisphaeraceae bacterium]|jgi:hypothetical protein